MMQIANGVKAELLPTRKAPCVLVLASPRHGQEELMRVLTLAGAMVEKIADVPAILTRLRQDPLPDLVVLEGKTPEMSEIEVLQRVRESGASIAVLALAGLSGSARNNNQPSQTAQGIADTQSVLQHLVKSMELLMVNNGLRVDGSEAMPAQLGAPGESGLELDLDVSRALWKGRRVPLSLIEFRIVRRLAASPGVDVSHRELYDLIKGEGFLAGRDGDGYRNNVRAAIKRIRRKFLAIDPEFRAIHSYHGFGYHWDEAGTPDQPDEGHG